MRVRPPRLARARRRWLENLVGSWKFGNLKRHLESVAAKWIELGGNAAYPLPRRYDQLVKRETNH